MNLAWLMFWVLASADTSGWVSGNYEINGYSKKSQLGNNRIEIRAQMAKGFSFGEFEEVEKPEITIQSSQGNLTFASDLGLSKDDEIILQGNVTVELKSKNKKVLGIKASTLHFQLSDLTLRSPLAEIWVSGKTKQNLAIHVDLQRRILHSPSKNLELKF